MAIQHKPDGFGTVTPYLVLDDAAGCIKFMEEAFGAEEMYRANAPNGQVMHAQVRIGDSMVELGNASAEWPAVPAALHLYVEDADAVYKAALDAGATALTELRNTFYGDREGNVKDPFGNLWFIATRVEEVSEEEMDRRMAEMREQ